MIIRIEDKPTIELLQNLKEGRITQQELVSRMGWRKYDKSLSKVDLLELQLRDRLKLELGTLLNINKQEINGRRIICVEKHRIEIIEMNHKSALIEIKENA